MQEQGKATGKKGSLTMTLTAKNAIVLLLPSGETIEVCFSNQYAKKNGKAGITIKASRDISIYRTERESNEIRRRSRTV